MIYKEVETQAEYCLLLEEIIKETQNYVQEHSDVPMYKSILNQLIDIDNLIRKKRKLSEDEIYKRYTIGAIAVKNFDTQNEMYGRKLQDLFGGLFEYYDMPKS